MVDKKFPTFFPIICLYVLCSVLCCPLRFLYKNSLPYVFTSSCLYEGSCLIYVICVCMCTVVSNTYVYPMLPVFLDCPFLVAPSVFNVSVFCKEHRTYRHIIGKNVGHHYTQKTIRYEFSYKQLEIKT
jgi:hypothetical protein